ncbi:hypothetical protein [Pseudomonas aeruginosa]|nr:hypothetical protein [Pseudomonas aeruginosa]
MASQLTGLIGAVVQNPDASQSDLDAAAWAARNSTQYNFLAHELDEFEEEASQCKAKGNCKDVQDKYRALSVANDDALTATCSASSTACVQNFGYLAAERLAIQKKIEALYTNDDIPLELKADLHRYNMQNVAAMGQLLQASAALDLRAQGVSPDNAAWGASLAAAMAGAILGGAKATGAAGKPLVSKGSEVTPEVIQKALQGDPAISAQGAVSLPAVQRYVDRLLKGDVAPAIKMDGNVIVDGNHRYIAAKILGRNPDVTPGALPPNKVGQTKPVSELKVDQVDWGNR